MELGATVCTPRAPSCTGCPLQRTCAAYKQQQEWAQKRLELAKSAAKGFFSPATVSKTAPAPAGDEEMYRKFIATPPRLLPARLTRCLQVCDAFSMQIESN